ncbi:MAG: DUF5681 domain-containing protein [Candidatus Cloacimonetes bacterium]|jgi:hypothetical protein|nr:DUF5681 domain-containing protein [Candidatus Cloacimonadota bacterium]
MFQKGVSGNPNGRPKGGSNKDTIAIKKAYTALLTNNVPKVQRWLDRVAADDPAKALDFLIKLSPFVVPKKTENDITLENPINIVMPDK